MCHGGQGICQQKETGKRPLFKPRAALRDPTLMCFLPRMTVVQGRAVEDKVEGDGKGFHPDCQWTVPEVVHEVLGIPCKVSAGGMQSFWKGTLQCSWAWTLPVPRPPAGGRLTLRPSAEQPSAAALMNESRYAFFFFFFQQNNSFSGVICIPMDGLSPLLTLLCVCMGCACWGRVVREKRWCASESSRWGGGGCCWEGHASGLLLIAMFNRLFLWRLGQLAAALFPLHVLSAACFLAWTRKGGFTSFRNAHEVQVYGIKYWSRFFFIKKKKTWHSLGLMNLCPPCLGRCLWICVAVLHAVCGRKPAAPVNIAVPCGAH